MATLIVLCGLQCSGKSTKSKQIKLNCDSLNINKRTIILSSDEIRKEYPDLTNDKVFSKLYSDMNYWLRQDDNVIIDATNTTIKSRAQIFRNLQVNCTKICHVMNVNYDECLKRLRVRNQNKNNHFVPEEILKKYYYSFEIPFYEEGWDNITFEFIPDYNKSLIYLSNSLAVMETFNQKNLHHTQLLGKHCETVGKLIYERTNNKLLEYVGKFHDVGKLYTQTYKENDPNAHYYNHANVGTYNLMCNSFVYKDSNSYDIIDTLDWLFYINYHMHLFNVKSEKSEKKWRSIFSDKKYDNLKIFNECDKSRIDDEENKNR